jgi:hypothetical protein
MSEVQAVAHTMEVLLACNRTQSGGNTYYCVDYLFRNPALVVLCPYSSHAEPLNICLELGEEAGSGLDAETAALAALMSDDEVSVGGAQSSNGSLIRDRARKVQSVRLPRLHPQDKPAPFVRSNSMPKSSSLQALDSPAQPQPGEVGVVSPPQGGALFRGFASPPRSPALLESPLLSPTSANDASTSTMAFEHEPHRPGRPVIRVKIQANTQYKICPVDPQDDDEDIWRCVGAKCA